MTAAPSDMVVSRNRLEGSLAETSLDKVLEACHKHLVTGAIKLTDGKGKRGVLVLRAGAVDQARFGDFVGDAAVEAMNKLDDGSYELAQRLPDLSGHMQGSAALEGLVVDVALIPIMRHCEQQALSVEIVVIAGFDRGEIHYRAGELDRVTLNGKRDDDAIVTILGWKDARFRCAAPPLAADIHGWPKLGREQTQPFKLQGELQTPEMDAAARRHAERVAAEPKVVSPLAEPSAPVAKAAPRRQTFSAALVEGFLLTVACTLALSLVALLASR